ncbi:unnamed protein product [Paramecium primaurelia]|uniref:Transmembrane protein n=1 Tax=Paramecium primaurelia TaxID=5886 RepID=A0A8S1NYJ9_PARPR|nr:unnamed protein product [Paramecium primaurelia]
MHLVTLLLIILIHLNQLKLKSFKRQKTYFLQNSCEPLNIQTAKTHNDSTFFTFAGKLKKVQIQLFQRYQLFVQTIKLIRLCPLQKIRTMLGLKVITYLTKIATETSVYKQYTRQYSACSDFYSAQSLAIFGSFKARCCMKILYFCQLSDQNSKFITNRFIKFLLIVEVPKNTLIIVVQQVIKLFVQYPIMQIVLIQQYLQQEVEIDKILQIQMHLNLHIIKPKLQRQNLILYIQNQPQMMLINKHIVQANQC